MLLHTLSMFFLGVTAVVTAMPGRSNRPWDRTIPQRSTEIALDRLTTNAERFARGLPPLSPKRKASGTESAKRSTISPSLYSPSLYSGSIKVSKTNGDAVGFMSKDLQSGLYTLDTSVDNTLAVTFTTKASGTSDQIEIRDASNHRISSPYIGGVIPSGGNLGPGSANYVQIVGVDHTNSGALPASSIGNGGIESSIWTYDSSTNKIAAQWINYDSSSPTTSIYYDPTAGGSFALTGDGELYQAAHPSAYPVVFST